MDRKKYSLILSIILVFSVVFSYVAYTFGNKQQKVNYNEVYQVAEACRNLCLYAKDLLAQQNKSLNSECLSEIPLLISYWPYENWVCDVVHVPRQEIDNLPQNQCKSFLSGKAKNFVEVSPNCTIVRIYYNGKVINLQ